MTQKKTVCAIPGAVVMDLHERVSDAYRTGGVDVESNEDERTVMASAILDLSSGTVFRYSGQVCFANND